MPPQIFAVCVPVKLHNFISIGVINCHSNLYLELVDLFDQVKRFEGGFNHSVFPL
jgi:hypothetical protein